MKKTGYYEYKSFPETQVICKEKNFPKFDLVSTHWHTYYEFHVILSGYGVHVVNDSSYHYKKGNIALFSLSDLHRMEIHEPTSLINFEFPKSMIDPVALNEIQKNAPIIVQIDDEQEFEQLKQMLYEFKDELDKKGALQKEYIYHLFNRILFFLLKHKRVQLNTQNTMPKKFNKALSYIQEHFSEDLALQQIAALFDLTPNYLGSLFHKNLGIGFVEYLQRLRMDHAKILLKQTDLSTTDISSLCGINSSSYFAKVFKRYYNMTPEDYRKRALSKAAAAARKKEENSD